MRRRIVALVAGVASVILGLIILLRPSGNDRQVVRTDGPSPDATPEAPEPGTASSAAAAPGSGFSIPNPLNLLELGKFQAAVSGQNQRLSLHALVRDQYNQPVPHVQLLVGMRKWKVAPPLMIAGENWDVWVTADEQGRVDYDGGAR